MWICCPYPWFTNIVVIGGDTIPREESNVNEGEYVNQAIIDIMDFLIPHKIWDSNNRLSGIAPTGVQAIENDNGSKNQRPISLTKCARLQEAVQIASQVVDVGDVVLFSPGGTSYDEFNDFEDRGEAYKRWVKELL